jgi:hypothetical protein
MVPNAIVCAVALSLMRIINACPSLIVPVGFAIVNPAACAVILTKSFADVGVTVAALTTVCTKGIEISFHASWNLTSFQMIHL